MTLLRIALRLYTAWPLRPHCSVAGCVLACRLTRPLQCLVKDRCWYWQKDVPPRVPRVPERPR